MKKMFSVKFTHKRCFAILWLYSFFKNASEYIDHSSHLVFYENLCSLNFLVELHLGNQGDFSRGLEQNLVYWYNRKIRWKKWLTLQFNSAVICLGIHIPHIDTNSFVIDKTPALNCKKHYLFLFFNLYCLFKMLIQLHKEC